MAGLPIPVKVSPEQMILSIKDLQSAASAKLPEGIRGMDFDLKSLFLLSSLLFP